MLTPTSVMSDDYLVCINRAGVYDGQATHAMRVMGVVSTPSWGRSSGHHNLVHAGSTLTTSRVAALPAVVRSPLFTFVARQQRIFVPRDRQLGLVFKTSQQTWPSFTDSESCCFRGEGLRPYCVVWGKLPKHDLCNMRRALRSQTRSRCVVLVTEHHFLRPFAA